MLSKPMGRAFGSKKRVKIYTLKKTGKMVRTGCASFLWSTPTEPFSAGKGDVQ